MSEILDNLVKTIRERKNSSEEKSYTKKILKNKKLSKDKVIEEINELFEAVEILSSNNKVFDAKPDFFNSDVKEAADVLYHLLVYLEANNIEYEEVLQELQRRTSQSGIKEKENRK
jgi:phosphoribosyl-ATP pyrophosphohydrolase